MHYISLYEKKLEECTIVHVVADAGLWPNYQNFQELQIIIEVCSGLSLRSLRWIQFKQLDIETMVTWYSGDFMEAIFQEMNFITNFVRFLLKPTKAFLKTGS